MDLRKLVQKCCARCGAEFRSLPKHSDRQHCNACHTFLTKKGRKPLKSCRGCDLILPDRRADFCEPCRKQNKLSYNRQQRRNGAPNCTACGSKIYRGNPDRTLCFECHPIVERQRLYQQSYCAGRKVSDPAYALRIRMLSRMRALRRALKVGGAKSATELFSSLGYDVADLREHVERHFTPAMTWELFASGEIHLDHKRPVASFDWQNDYERSLRECWALSNLQPLWKIDNMKKGARWNGRDYRGSLAA
jgi:ribosomal protein S27AE